MTGGTGLARLAFVLLILAGPLVAGFLGVSGWIILLFAVLATANSLMSRTAGLRARNPAGDGKAAGRKVSGFEGLALVIAVRCVLISVLFVIGAFAASVLGASFAPVPSWAIPLTLSMIGYAGMAALGYVTGRG